MSNPFTLRRWNRNPFQMWALLLMMYVSFNQIFFIQDTGVMSEQARQAQLMLALCNVFGGMICMTGLHLRDKTTAMWIEMCSYISLIGSMGIYVGLVWSVTLPPNTSFGLGLSQAFVVASLHRAVLIAVDQIRRYRKHRQMKRLYRTQLLDPLTAGQEDKKDIDE